MAIIMRVPCTSTYLQNSTHIGKTDEDIIVSVTVVLRRKPGHIPLPKMEDYIGCPPRTRLSVDEFVAKHVSASQAEVDALVKHVSSFGIQYRDSHLARRHVRD